MKLRNKLSIKTLLPLVGLLAVGVIAMTPNLAQLSQDLRSQAALSSNRVDVVVVGAGTGGIAAALQAARDGATVILLEETDWIGGQMTAAGVTSMDGGDPKWTGGIYKEFTDRVKAHYKAKGKSVGTCYFGNNSTCFEPKVGKDILMRMIEEQPNISLRLRTEVLRVSKSDNKVKGLVVKQNGTNRAIRTKVLIDATEYGDVLPLAGARYRSGNSMSTALKTEACIQDITYLAVIKKYPNGVPQELMIKDPPPGYTQEVRNKFARVVTKNGSRYFGTYPHNWAIHNAYRGMPDSSNPKDYTGVDASAITKTGVNWANDYHATVRYLEDKTYRKQVNCEAKLQTIQFLYYVQTELGENLWSVANDEGYDTDYNRVQNSCDNIPTHLKAIERQMPVMPYVREGRRVVGLETLTGKDIKRKQSGSAAEKSFASSIAVGDYPVDLHGCAANADLEQDLESRSDWPEGNVSGPFQVPMEALVSSDIDGLLVAEKNISQSRLANGATRLQPITMLTGQAAGALAALATQQKVSPKEIRYADVQRKLLEAKAVLTPFTDVVTTDPTFKAIQQGTLRGIMIGTGPLTFSPDAHLTRGQLAVVLSRALGLAEHKPTNPTFADVPTNHPFFPQVEGIYKLGLTAGCSTNPMKFCPEQSLTNAQLAVLALKGWQAKNSTISINSGSNQTYGDLPRTHWAAGFVEGLAAHGVVWRCDTQANKFCPDQPVLRKNAIYVLMEIVNKM